MSTQRGQIFGHVAFSRAGGFDGNWQAVVGVADDFIAPLTALRREKWHPLAVREQQA